MPINKERADKIGEMAKTMSRKQIAKNLGIKRESVSRYLKFYRRNHRLQLDDTPEYRAKILLLDIETLPAEARVWGTFKVNISTEQITRYGCMLGFAVKWLFEPTVYSEILTPKEALAHDDERITKLAWLWLNSADVICAHNGKAFDTQYLNSRFIVHGLTPPSPYKIIDTLNIRKVTRFTKNSLDSLTRELGLRPKTDTGGFGLWNRCAEGDGESLKFMREYNENDTLALEELYIRLRAWLPSHPNLALYSESKDGECGKCGCKEMEYAGQYATTVNLFKSFRCLNPQCGAINRARISDTPFKKHSNLLVNTNVQ
jgi:RNase_H superfamily